MRLVLGGPGLAGFTTTGVPDEWVGLIVPGQFQSRYYTVRSWDGGELVLDVVVHEVGLVTEWAAGDCVGDTVTVTEPKGSFAMPGDAAWLLLVGDLTALPAMARIAESVVGARRGSGPRCPTTWPTTCPAAPTSPGCAPPAPGEPSWPRSSRRSTGRRDEGYFWMAGESAPDAGDPQAPDARARRCPSTAYDVMGYWRGGAVRQPRAVDPGPIWRAGKAAGQE